MAANKKQQRMIDRANAGVRLAWMRDLLVIKRENARKAAEILARNK